MGLYKTKNLQHSKRNNRVKRQQEWEKIFANNNTLMGVNIKFKAYKTHTPHEHSTYS